jgi:hypothetical protein
MQQSVQFNHKIPNQIFLNLYCLLKYAMQNDFANWQLQQESFALKQMLQLPKTWNVHCKKVLYFHSKSKIACKRWT